MRNKLVSTFMFFSLFLLSMATSSTTAGTPDMIWKNVSRGISKTDFKIVKINSEDHDNVYVSSRKAVYKTLNGGRSWDEIFSYRGRGGGINTFSVAPSDANSIFVGTDDGLYRSSNAGAGWKKVYSGIGKPESSVLTVAVFPSNPDLIYIGTRSGLYKTDKHGNNWAKDSILGTRTIISHISIDPFQPTIVYAAANDGIYKSIDGGSEWDRVFFVNYSKSEPVEALTELANFEEAELLTENKIKSIRFDPTNSNIIYAGTSEGLYISNNSGSNWFKASEIGLLSSNIRDITITRDSLIYAATDRGIFRYSLTTKSWVAIYRGLTSANIYHLDSVLPEPDNTISLWAATSKGIYKTVPDTQEVNPGLEELETKDIFGQFANEPSIEEIRESAIWYAEVHPDKINKWRKAADKKAWLPSLSFAYQKKRDWQSSSYFYSTTSQKYTDDDITDGNDEGWSVSLSWDFSDLIWSGDQTSIDNRSKLMVQLRDDILNEVTRLFFERRRLQIETITAPQGELTERIDNELRLQELTANIDALTGSYLSKRLRQSGDMGAGL